ncbi:FHA domain-containing protein [Haliangium ochraceum]|uniref:FHA domain containing protein n=1 Tax=Haliangium ochraceum (strain DSM 14365 / JCM 11303 / SMP-2) TaxID=502025 RepID=D0LIQ7_HALO1|nr:FHA domain-containing protein [Haliangium ochraceum]ACY12936.1 FHA domain containing protein [Haliangium ochraceum DSM 14365]
MGAELPRITLTYCQSDKSVQGTGLCELGCREIYTEISGFGSRVIFLGADPSSHVRVDDPYVSGRQLAILREGEGWLVSAWPNTHNPTYLDGRELTEISSLMAGSVLRAGRTAWVVTSTPPEAGEVHVRARNLIEFCVAAYRIYGTTRKAASAIGMSDRTFRRRLLESEEGTALLADRRPQPRKRHACHPMGVPVVTTDYLG